MATDLSAPSFAYGLAVTPSDLTTSFNITNARYLHNSGTAGAVVIRQKIALAAPGAKSAAGIAPTAATTCTIYLTQGETHECGTSWENVNATGLGAGVVLTALY